MDGDYRVQIYYHHQQLCKNKETANSARGKERERERVKSNINTNTLILHNTITINSLIKTGLF